MALAQNTFDRQQQPREKRTFPVIREQSYVLDYLGVTEKMDVAFEDRHKAKDDPTAKLVPVIEWKLVVVLPGADEAQAKVEALPTGTERDAAFEVFKKKYLDKGHGRFFWLKVNKTISAGTNGKKKSNAYIHCCGFLNDGEELTKEQMRQLPALLNALEEETSVPQFYGYIEASGGKNKLLKISGRVPEDERLPSWRPMARAIDPREADDTPGIVCEVCGDAIHGYEITMGDEKGTWLTNEDAAERSREKYGKVLCPPHIRAAKAAAVASTPSGTPKEQMPF